MVGGLTEENRHKGRLGMLCANASIAALFITADHLRAHYQTGQLLPQLLPQQELVAEQYAAAKFG